MIAVGMPLLKCFVRAKERREREQMSEQPESDAVVSERQPLRS